MPPTVCPSCGRENPEGFVFCGYCRAPLAAAPAPREVRKTVTVVFSDVTGSTALGERLDPESLRRVMSRYFDEMRAVLERHGGTVEKFIGDAVMAVFGIPVLHEDDALRAVRAAAEMRDALTTLNAELQRERGVTIATRTGVNTGEVVAGDPSAGQTLVTGDAVNTAARLEQAAAPSEILLGEATFRLVRDAVKVEVAPAVAAKGKADPVPTFRLLEVVAGAPAFARRLDSPMVGRSRELHLLSEAFDRAVSERGCHLFTVLGSAGVGKSRLVEEFLGLAADRARVLRGRCLPYGDGITFWPVAEVVKQAAGISDEDTPEAALARIARLVDGTPQADAVVQRVGQMIGLTRDSAVPQETFWGVRMLLEAVAAREPLVVVFDDIHWGEPTLLDLVDHVADWSREVPILLLAVGRPELLDDRPAWGGGKMNATSILLESLSEEDCHSLIANLLGTAQVPVSLADRITDAAEGNPLFVEEMVAMLIDDGLLRRRDGRWEPSGDLSTVAVPSTIQALLAARLDRLSHAERTVLERAAIEGKVFSLAAVTELCGAPLADDAPRHLMALVRKELVRPQRTELGADAFRFRHLLIRDAAYDAIPKSERADLHERFAGWLERTAADRAREYEEIVGYHLEQAYRYRAELGPVDDVGRGLARRAAERLASAGRRALGRGDLRAASSLLGRAVALCGPDDPLRLRLAPDLGVALRDAGELSRAMEILDDAVGLAERSGDARAAARARIERRLVQLSSSADLPPMEELIEEVEREVPLLEEAGDHEGLSRAWALRVMVGNMLTDFEGMARYAELAIHHGRLGGRIGLDLFAALGAALIAGPVHAREALARTEAVVGSLPPGKARDMWLMYHRAEGLTMLGDEAGARHAATRARELAADLGGGISLSHATWQSAHVERDFERLDDAERFYREADRQLQAMGERSWRSTLLCELGLVFWGLGRDDEALELARQGRELAASDDILTQVEWRDVEALVLSRRGETVQAERLAQEALEFAERMDSPVLRADALRSLSVVLAAADRREEAVAALREAIGLLDSKGALHRADRVRRELADLEDRPG